LVDGRLAEIAYIDTLVDDSAGLSAEALQLKARIQELERSVIIMRGRKAEYLEADYWSQMETLLVELARATARFNAQYRPDDSTNSQTTQPPQTNGASND